MVFVVLCFAAVVANCVDSAPTSEYQTTPYLLGELIMIISKIISSCNETDFQNIPISLQPKNSEDGKNISENTSSNSDLEESTTNNSSGEHDDVKTSTTSSNNYCGSVADGSTSPSPEEGGNLSTLESKNEESPYTPEKDQGNVIDNVIHRINKRDKWEKGKPKIIDLDESVHSLATDESSENDSTNNSSDDDGSESNSIPSSREDSDNESSEIDPYNSSEGDISEHKSPSRSLQQECLPSSTSSSLSTEPVTTPIDDCNSSKEVTTTSSPDLTQSIPESTTINECSSTNPVTPSNSQEEVVITETSTVSPSDGTSVTPGICTSVMEANDEPYLSHFQIPLRYINKEDGSVDNEYYLDVFLKRENR
ncbi:putative protein TPRXL isoform X1 [Agrilus planipennis]|uniref:Dentin sialophosphoprotein-like n=1 Tax=Agrilus planipennis TaxID=224129 RepID=A0A1W4WDB3_AGRPL|nr:putative protein TPRXL isoform X1 [Agrilus planipennis]